MIKKIFATPPIIHIFASTTKNIKKCNNLNVSEPTARRRMCATNMPT